MHSTLSSSILVLLSLACLSARAEVTSAVFPGNEAVSASPIGKRVVKYPAYTEKPVWPAPRFLKTPHSNRAPTNLPTGTLMMIEGESGLMECTEMSNAPSVCRQSTLGQQLRPRIWFVLLHGQWQTCEKASSSEKADYNGYNCLSFRKQGILVNPIGPRE